jgi:CO/xanthine dehydrogenase Mo-binding subunit
MWSGSMEPRVAIAQWDGDYLTVWASSQSPFRVHGSLAAMFNLPDGNVRIIASYCRRRFRNQERAARRRGAGGDARPQGAVAGQAAVLARRRNPRLEYTLPDPDVRAYRRQQGHDAAGPARQGVRQSGRLPYAARRARESGDHIYRIPNVKTEQYRVHTNIPNTGPTRGVGDPQETFGIESAIDEIANEMGWDPMEFRLKNIKRNGDPIARGGSGTEDGRLVTQVLHRCIEEGAARIDWNRRNNIPGSGSATPKARGIGVACTERGGGGGLAGASVKVNLDGSAHVFYASTDIGTGSRTTLAMIASEVLGIPLANFRTTAGDTEVAPYDNGSHGNRTLQGTGRAVEAAARDCLQQILAAAGPMLNNATPADLEIRDSVVRVKADLSRNVPLRMVMQRRGRSVIGDGGTTAPQTGVDVERTSAAHFVEVEVDTETGKVRILRYVSAHDVGRPINVTIVENQIEGGTIQGLALTQGEELRFDPRTGACLTGSFVDLKPPTALDFDPRVIEAVIIPNEGVTGPFGGKGLGENPCHPGMAAVANAIYNALGVRLREVPFTRAKILAALEQRTGVRTA